MPIVDYSKYSSIADGTFTLGGSSSESSSSSAATETKAAKKTTTSEDSYQSIDISGMLDDLDAQCEAQYKAITDQFNSIVQNIKQNISSAKCAAGPTFGSSNVSNDSSPCAATGKLSGSEKAFAKKFNSKFKGTLAGKGADVVSIANKYGINPALLSAIMALETGWGTSSACVKKNNPGGIMDPAKNWSTTKHFGTIQEGIEYMARNLKKNYIDKGLKTIPAIGRKYCPVGAANDPNGTNSGWIPNVTRIYKQLSA